MLIQLDEEKIFNRFTEDTIERMMTKYNLSYLGAIIYLYTYNDISISEKDLKENNGSEMYIKFARRISQLVGR